MAVLNIFKKGRPADAVDIMRGTKWGNRFKIEPGRTRHQALEEYRVELWAKVDRGEVSLEELADLHGRDLLCCCAPRPCHGDVLEAAAAWAHEELERK